MTSTSRESGIQPDRLEFVRENAVGVAPSDPSWILYSDTVRTRDASIDPGIEPQENTGTADYEGSFAGTEEATLTVTYDLQQWLIDGSSDAQDAAYDGIARTSDNRLPNTHTVVRRMDVANLDAGNTINGSNSKDTRLYFVGKGGKVDSATLTANIDSGQPIQVELEYMFEKARRYQIDQPGSAKQIAIKCSADDSSDQGTTVTIQGVDDGDSETEVTVDINSSDATTLEDTDTKFKEIDAIEVASELVNDLEVYEDDDSANDSVTQGDQLAVLYGQSSYDQGEGDLGVPALGSGSHASALNSSYELPLDGDKFELPSGTTIADEITSTEMSFSNNVDAKSQHDGPRPTLVEGGRDAEVSATVFGQTETYQHTVDMLRNVENDFKWTAEDPSSSTGSITLGNIDVTEVGSSEEARQDVIEVDLTLSNQESVTIA